jgi:hypothetical protein
MNLAELVLIASSEQKAEQFLKQNSKLLTPAHSAETNLSVKLEGTF